MQYEKFKIIYNKDTMAYTEIWSLEKIKLASKEFSISPEFIIEILNGHKADTPKFLILKWIWEVSNNYSKISIPTFPLDRSWIENYGDFNPAIRALVDATVPGAYLHAIGLETRPSQPCKTSEVYLTRHPGAGAYMSNIDQWRELFTFYDLVIAYGAAPIIPYLAGSKNFVAYEHGTLRDLPFDGTLQGELIAASYAEAAAVFVTNNDYLNQARQLPISPQKIHCLPHAFDERPLREHLANNTPRLSDVVTFFAPARQDWVKQFPSMTKNNHFVVHAARALAKQGCKKFRVIFVEWGEDVEATKKLIEELDVVDFFEWQRPLAKRALWSAYASAHAVIDQFLLPSISGVSFEALALGCRVITCDDGVSNARAFGKQPPLLPAQDIVSVTHAMKMVIDDPNDLAGIGESAWEWIDSCHSADRIVEIQETVFAKLPNIMEAK